MDPAAMLSLAIALGAATLRVSTPIALGAIGETLSERAGVVNLGIEGVILSGAFFAVLGSYLSGNAYVGVACALAVGLLLGFLHALFVLTFRANQIVVGVGMNILALGLTAVGLQAVWGNRGKSDSVDSLSAIRLGPLESIPLLGPILNGQTALVYLMLILAVATWFLLFRTTLGLRLRVVGENPRAADTVGIGVVRLQYLAVTLGGGLMGLGGAYLSLSDLDLFGKNMSAGRGFIALAATILGNWNPLGALAGSLLFGFLDALQIYLQGTGFPTQFIQMIPYVLVIFLLAGVVRRVRAPEAVGRVYERGS